MGKRRHRRKKTLQLHEAQGENLFEATDDAGDISKSTNYPVEKLLEMADNNIDSFKFDVAEMFCQRALEVEPENVQALETFASLCLEAGKTDEAKESLEKAVQLSPEEGHSKYMTLGQLAGGHAALAHYLKGIDILSKAVEALAMDHPVVESACAADPQRQAMVRELSTAYCCTSELYMTDCCFEEDAEQQCLRLIEKAIEVDPSNPEAYQYMASFQLIKEELDRSKEMIQKSLSLWLPQYQTLREGKADATDDTEVIGEMCPVSIPSRISAVKLLIELELFDDAATILEGLVEEDDEIVEVWYLHGWCNYLRGADYKGNARYYFNKCKEVHNKVECDDLQMLAHVEELLSELGPDEEDNIEDETVEPDNSDPASSEDEMEQDVF